MPAAADPSTEPPDAPAPSAPPEREEWLEDLGELPPRPRRRLIAPLPLSLLGVLLLACGFIAGVLVEKGQGGSSSASPASAFASRLAGLRSAAGGTRSGAAGASAGGFAGGGATTGTVSFAHDGKLYITTGESNTVEVQTSAATSVTKTATTSVRAIHPGETVTVTGSTASNGTLQAESIRVGSSGLGSLFGAGAGAGSARSGGTGSSSSSGSEGPALFGSG